MAPQSNTNSPLSLQREDDESGRLTSLRIDLMSPSPTPITRTLNLLIRPSFGFHLSAHGDTSEISERVYVETSLKRLEDWTTHEQAHNDLRELVSIAAWRQFGIRRTLVQRHDDPERVMSVRDPSVLFMRCCRLLHTAAPTGLRFRFSKGLADSVT